MNTVITDKEIEQEIKDKGLTAPRVSMDMILDAIKETTYHRLDGTTITVCVLKLKNGFTVTGESAALSAENFDEELGKRIARQAAIDKCWPLFGFHLASILSGWEMDS